jgi:hypothetical protein
MICEPRVPKVEFVSPEFERALVGKTVRLYDSARVLSLRNVSLNGQSTGRK